MSEYNVFVIAQESYERDEIAAKLGKYFKSHNFDFTDKTILLKPSFVLPVGDEGATVAVNTHNAVTSGVAKSLSQLGADRVIIAEHRTIGPARYAFYMAGIKHWVRDLDNVEMCYLDEKKRETVEIEDPFIEDHTVKYPKLLLDGTVDYFISVPKLKTNIFAGVTSSVKNNFGLVSKDERLKYHGENVHQNLADLMLIRQPDLIITDAIVSGEGQGPEQPTPVNSDMIIISDNCLAGDSTCCYLMGQNPREIGYLTLLYNRGYGPLELSEIKIENREYLDSKKKTFKKPDSDLDITPEINVHMGKKACQGGCLGMIRGILDSYALAEGWDSLGKLNIILGDDLEIPEESLDRLDKKRTLVYGDCAKKYKQYGTFFGGCPPDYTRSLLKIWLRGPLEINPHLKLQYVSPYKYGKAWVLHILQRIFRF